MMPIRVVVIMAMSATLAGCGDSPSGPAETRLPLVLPPAQPCEFPSTTHDLGWILDRADHVVHGVAGASRVDPRSGSPFTRTEFWPIEPFNSTEFPSGVSYVWVSGDAPILDDGGEYVLFLDAIGRTEPNHFAVARGVRGRFVVEDDRVWIRCPDAEDPGPEDGQGVTLDVFTQRLRDAVG